MKSLSELERHFKAVAGPDAKLKLRIKDHDKIITIRCRLCGNESSRTGWTAPSDGHGGQGGHVAWTMAQWTLHLFDRHGKGTQAQRDAAAKFLEPRESDPRESDEGRLLREAFYQSRARLWKAPGDEKSQEHDSTQA